MDLVSGKKREAVGRLATRLLSRDPVEVNAAINSTFAPNVIYRGHGLEIRGASNVKHAAWFWNTIDAGKAASFALHDIHWDEQLQSATIRTQRFIRPRLFPLIGVNVEVPARFHFKSSGGSAYVTRFEEIWPTERLLSHFTIVQAVHEALFKTLWTLFVLTLSNITFAAFAQVNTFRYNTLDPQLGRAKNHLPRDVARGIDTGFYEGSELAHGYGTFAVDLFHKLTYPPVRIVEASVQFVTLLAQRVLPVKLPYPYVYNEHALPPQTLAETEPFAKIKHDLPAPVEAPTEPSQDPHVNTTTTTTASKEEQRPARVQVGPTLDGTMQGKSVEIEQRIGTETKDLPAQAAATGNDSATGQGSLFDQLRKEGQDPIAEAAKAAAQAEQNTKEKESNGHAAAGSSDESMTTTKSTGNNGASKKKKNKKKKNNGGGGANGASAAAHPAPPSFKEGLAEAEGASQ